jgi:hypothetical protein
VWLYWLQGLNGISRAAAQRRNEDINGFSGI